MISSGVSGAGNPLNDINGVPLRPIDDDILRRNGAAMEDSAMAR